jgi:hypothetical protein
MDGPRRLIAWIAANTSSCTSGARPTDGSSRMRRLGSDISARARQRLTLTARQGSGSLRQHRLQEGQRRKVERSVSLSPSASVCSTERSRGGPMTPDGYGWFRPSRELREEIADGQPPPESRATAVQSLLHEYSINKSTIKGIARLRVASGRTGGVRARERPSWRALLTISLRRGRDFGR